MADLGYPKNWLPGEARLKVIRAAIGAYNAERPDITKAHDLRVLAIMGPFTAVLLGAGLAALMAGNAPVLGGILTAGFLGGYHLWNFARKPAKAYRQELRNRLFPEIFGFIDGFRYANGKIPDFLAGLKATGVQGWQSSEHDDWFTGVHEGVIFELSETRFFSRHGRHKATLFDGLIFHILQPSGYDGLLLAQKKTNSVHRYFRDLFSRDLKTVQSGLPAVDATHEFRASAESPSQQRLFIEMAKVLDWLQSFWRHGPVQIAFQGKDCYLLLAAGADHFELPHIKAGDINFDRDVLPLITDMVTLLAIARLISKIGKMD